MKKSLRTFALAFACCAMGATMLTACGGDDNGSSGGNGGGTVTKDTIPVAVNFRSTWYETAAILKYCDVCIEYDDGTGAKTDTLKTTQWDYIKAAKLPVTFTFKKTVTLRDSAGMASAESIHFTSDSWYLYITYSASGGTVDKANAASLPDSTGVKGAKKIALLIEKIKNGGLNKTEIYSFDAKGKMTYSNGKKGGTTAQ